MNYELGSGEIELKPQNAKTPTPKTCLGVSRQLKS